jgi:hypothetical protein
MVSKKVFALLAVAMILIGLATVRTVNVTPHPTTISTEELHRQIDMSTLPTSETPDAF